MINIGKTVTMSYHTKQRRFPMRPKINYRNRVRLINKIKIIPIFELQKRVMQSVFGAGTGTSCRQLFKDCKILTVTSLHVFEVLCFLK